MLLLLEYQAVAPFGHWSLLFLQLPYAVGILASGCATVILPFLLFRRPSRTVVLGWWIAAVVYLPLAVGGVVLGHHIRSWGFDRLAVRSVPVVAVYIKTRRLKSSSRACRW